MKFKKLGKVKGNKKVKLYNCDNMLLMKQMPDNYIDLAICDCPYGISTTNDAMGGRRVNKDARASGKTWDNELPPDEYFHEVMRVSKEWIFWGANYMSILWTLPRKNVIVWDKKIRGLDFADCEIGVSNIDDSARIYSRTANTKDRVHVNEKPVKLYEFLIGTYAEEKARLFDPNLGSFSSAIAAHFSDCKEFIGCELEEDYFKTGLKRFNKTTAQQGLIPGFGV